MEDAPGTAATEPEPSADGVRLRARALSKQFEVQELKLKKRSFSNPMLLANGIQLTEYDPCGKSPEFSKNVLANQECSKSKHS